MSPSSLPSSTLPLRLDYAAIVLAGGRSSRLGGTPKATLATSGRPLVEVVLDAVRDARMRVVVGDGPVHPGVLVTQEEPRYAGPAAAVAAGLRALRDAAVTSPWTVVLACDLPGVRDGIPLLLGAAARAEGRRVTARAAAPEGAALGDGSPGPATERDPGDSPAPTAVGPFDDDGKGRAGIDGWCLSEDGRLQWLFAIVRTAGLWRAVNALGDPTNRSMGALMGGLILGGLPAPAAVTADIDTWEDADRWLRP
ncbi:MAG TPA: nucleotidyltransferase family protein [Dermatophilaceae bacterium]|nr:nucleotidyltransferase family protein [Dermatophilaceae bacterium]